MNINQYMKWIKHNQAPSKEYEVEMLTRHQHGDPMAKNRLYRPGFRAHRKSRGDRL